MNNKKASESILDGVSYIINKSLKDAPIDKTVTGLIKKVSEDNLYDILLENKLYLNVPSFFKGLNVNDTVKVKIPQNQYSQMYIEGKYDMEFSFDDIEGTFNYNNLINKPKINDIVLQGDKTLSELGIQPKGNYLTKESDPTVPSYVKVIKKSDIEKWNNKSDFSGNYNDLTNKPTIPTVNNGTLTIQKNGTNVTSFSANSSTDKVANITVPTKTSELTNDSGFKSTDNNTTYTLTKEGSEIILNGSDGTSTKVVDSDTNTTYAVATISKLGLIKSGTDITVDTNGNVSVNDDSHNHVISNIDGLQTTLDGKEGKFLKNSAFNKNFETSSNNIKPNGTQSIGNLSTIPRADHVHPLQTYVTGNAGTATKLQTARKIAGASFDGTSDISISYNNLTDKPNIPSGVEVVDNLNSSSTTSGLSANQGRILKSYIDEKIIVSSSQPNNQQIGDIWYQEI